MNVIGLSILSLRSRYSSQDSSNTSNVDKEKGSGSFRSSYPKSGRIYYGKCLASMNGCFGCAKYVYRVRGYPYLKSKGRE